MIVIKREKWAVNQKQTTCSSSSDTPGAVIAMCDTSVLNSIWAGFSWLPLSLKISTVLAQVALAQAESGWLRCPLNPQLCLVLKRKGTSLQSASRICLYFLCSFTGPAHIKWKCRWLIDWSNIFLKDTRHWFQRVIGRSTSDSLGIHRGNVVYEAAVKLFSSLPWVFQIYRTYPRTCVYVKFLQGTVTVWNYSCTSWQLYVLRYVCCGLSGTKINAILLTSGPCQVTKSPFLAAACACLTFCLGLDVDLVLKKANVKDIQQHYRSSDSKVRINS